MAGPAVDDAAQGAPGDLGELADLVDAGAGCAELGDVVTNGLRVDVGLPPPVGDGSAAVASGLLVGAGAFVAAAPIGDVGRGGAVPVPDSGVSAVSAGACLWAHGCDFCWGLTGAACAMAGQRPAVGGGLHG